MGLDIRFYSRHLKIKDDYNITLNKQGRKNKEKMVGEKGRGKKAKL